MAAQAPKPDARALVTRVVDSIPSHHDSPQPADRLCREAGFGQDAASVGSALVALLGAFGVLEVKQDNGTETVKAKSAAAWYFLRSLAQYVGDDVAILENWARPGTTEAPYSASEVLSGPQFLYLMEQRRVSVQEHAISLRSTQVAQIVIKARFRGRGDRYLVIYDGKARQYQLPGGHRRSEDLDMRQVAQRELEEELPQFVFDAAKDRLVEIGTVTVPQLSRTFGVMTEYEMTIFQLSSARSRLPSGPGMRWVDEQEILSDAATVDGRTLNTVALRRFAKTLPGGLHGLDLSLRGIQRGALASAAVDRPWEFWGLVTGVLGIVVSVVLYFLT